MNDSTKITNFEQLNELERKERLASMSADFDSATREIKRIDKMTVERPQLQEDIFFNVFLPYFANTPERNYYFKDDEYQTGHEKAMTAWQHVLTGGKTGAPGERMVVGWIYSEVDIVNAQGQVVVTVPPIMRADMLDSGNGGQEDRPSVYRIVEQTNVMARISSRHGEMYLRNALSQASGKLISDESIIANLNAWNVVFRHYEFPEIPLGQHAQVPVAEQEANKSATATYNSNEFDDE